MATNRRLEHPKEFEGGGRKDTGMNEEHVIHGKQENRSMKPHTPLASATVPCLLTNSTSNLTATINEQTQLRYDHSPILQDIGVFIAGEGGHRAIRSLELPGARRDERSLCHAEAQATQKQEKTEISVTDCHAG